MMNTSNVSIRVCGGLVMVIGMIQTNGEEVVLAFSEARFFNIVTTAPV